MKITLIGGDAKLALHLKDSLERQDHRVTLLQDPAKALSAVAQAPPELLIVAALPSCRAAADLIAAFRGQTQTRRLPAFYVDVKSAPREVIELLDAGYDDCLAKPLNDQIFLARVRTLLRRQIWAGVLKEEPVTSLHAGDLSIALVERVVRVGDQEASLTRLEFDLLSFFVRNKDRVLERGRILEAVWKYPQDVETRTLDKHVETLRRKLGGHGNLIKTVHGVGYRFVDPQPSRPARRG